MDDYTDPMKILVAMLASGALLLAAGEEPRVTRVPAPLRVVLVGDSTVTEGSGWGLGFRELATDAVDVVNKAANGRSSKSFRDEGLWESALAERGAYTLIQFGHNDEPGKGPERETDPASTFPANLRRYIADVRAAGGTPILVTSLVRRIFDKDNGRIESTQEKYVAAAREVARTDRVPLLDLFTRSRELCEMLGPRALVEFSPRLAGDVLDTTHLNAAGSRVFARLVVRELREVVPALGKLFKLVV